MKKLFVLGSALLLASGINKGSAFATSSKVNNAYLDSAWFNGTHTPTDSDINNYTLDLVDHNIHTQFCDIGVINDDGTLPAQGYSQLGHWIQQARLDDPSVKIVPVLNYGNRKTNATFGSSTFNSNLNAAIQTLVSNFQIDGIHLDVEGFVDNDNIYLNLLNYLKSNALVSKPLSISTPATTWGSAFITQVAGVVQQMNPMIYDTMGWGSSVVDGPTYITYSQNVITTYSNAIGTQPCQLAPTLPSYEKKTALDGTVYHDPAVESMSNAITALNNAIASGANVYGAGIFWWPNYDGIHPDTYT